MDELAPHWDFGKLSIDHVELGYSTPEHMKE